MCIICEYKGDEKKLQGLKALNCGYCTSITTIPNIIGLRELFCRHCTSLTTIPNIVGLQILDCSWCTSLTTIPNIVGLQKLVCWGCTSLTTIPNIIGLQKLYCWGCTILTAIPAIIGLQILSGNGCKWIKPQNPNYDSNIKKLVKIQSFFRKWLWLKRLSRYLESSTFLDWYYSIEGPGGKNAIRRLEEKQLTKMY